MGENGEVTLDPTIISKPEAAKIGLYRGEKGEYVQRGIEKCEGIWNQDKENGFGPYSYDNLLTDSLKNAAIHGRKEVTVFDFGCGEGNLFNDFINADTTQSQAKAFLHAHPEIHIKLVGLTDTTGLNGVEAATARSRMHIPFPIPDKAVGASQIQAYRVLYAVTAAQPLDALLRNEHIANIDLATATASLIYLSPKNFSSVIKTLIDCLEPSQGMLLASPYSTLAPGVRLRANAANDGGEAYLDVHNIERDSGGRSVPSLKAAVSEVTNKSFYPDHEVEARIDMQEKALRLLKRHGVVKEEDYVGQITEARQQTRSYERHAAIWNIVDLLRGAQAKLGERLIQRSKSEKKQILSGFQSQYQDRAQVRFSDKIIEVRRSQPQTTPVLTDST